MAWTKEKNSFNFLSCMFLFELIMKSLEMKILFSKLANITNEKQNWKTVSKQM